MTNQDAIKRIVPVVANAIGSTTPVFPYSVKKDYSGTEYVVVNSLGLPYDQVLQEGIFNVNVHVKDVAGLVNNKRLFEISGLITSAIKNSIANGDDGYIFFNLKSEMIIQGDNSDHLINLRYKVFLSN